MELQRKRILIVGGYGHVGGNIARLIRKGYKSLKLVLAGRNPQKGENLSRELGNTETAYLDLNDGFEIARYGTVDLIITAMEDHKNIMREAAILNGIACIHISEVAEEISTTVFLSLHRTLSAPIVFAGHWQAGILTLVTKQVASRFKQIKKVQVAGLFDERDPVGPQTANEAVSFVGRALLRLNGKWQFVDAKENARTIHLSNNRSITGHPMSTLDVPSIAAFTSTPNIRFDFATGQSIGSYNGLAASHDLYIDIEGILLSGEKTELRTIVSDPQGNSHLTAVGAFLIAESIILNTDQSAPFEGGIYLPENIVSSDNIISRLKEFGVSAKEEISSN